MRATPHILAMLALAIWFPYPVRAQRPTVPDPQAMALLCTITRAWAANSDELEVLGCSPDVVALPPERQPCELRAPDVEPVTLRFDATGHLSEATHTLVFDGGRLPMVVAFENDARGIVAIHGTNVEATVRREAGATILVTSSDEPSHLETRYESGPSGVAVVETALVSRDGRDVSSRWESSITGGVRTSTRAGGDRAELEWDAQGRPIRFLTVAQGSYGPRTHEVRYTWNAAGQLTGETPRGGLVNPTEIRYRCGP